AQALSAELEKLGAVVAIEPPLSPRAPAYESGLAAAQPGAAPAADTHALGALARDDGLTLSSLDGEVVETQGNEEALSRPVRIPAAPVAAKPPPSPPPAKPSTSPPAPAAQAATKNRPATPSQSGPTVPAQTQPPRVEFRPSGQAPATSAPRPATPPP